MYSVDLKGVWQVESTFLRRPINGLVPGSVYQDMLRAGLIPDPFVGENEWQVRDVMRHDFSYSRSFDFDLKKYPKPVLVMEGVDTLSKILINGKLVGETRNMHRTYRFPLDTQLQDIENKITITLYSPIRYFEDKLAHAEHDLYQARDSIKGYVYLRKAHAMMGWDWGPQLPDAGIWRDIRIESEEVAAIRGIMINQKHLEAGVELTIEPEIEVLGDTKEAKCQLRVVAPNGSVLLSEDRSMSDPLVWSIMIKDPCLWFPRGYGGQPLYTISASIVKSDIPIHVKEERIGLRSIKLVRNQDEYGESFTFSVNGIKIFAKGSNYIIEDNLLGRMTRQKTNALLEAAALANHNMVRVWGGGIYPPDYFYEIADRLGLLIWQDLMFACSVYELTDDFIDEIRHEIRDNLRRIRNHACLALICGNNENEEAITNWNVPSVEYSRISYLRQYVELIPKWVEAYAPGLFYWPSSPSSGTTFANPNSDNYGDVHYWGVWHNTEPITNYRKHFPRFMSEFGLQSFPALDTVKTFAEPKDYNIFSKVMEHHQKNSTANSRILVYIGMMFRYPKDFSSLLYVSQLIQAEGIRYGVEHMRRNYGRSMGTLYWQLNDCWPVASWSSIDYYHRWKALHYHSRKFYAPVLLSLEESRNQVGLNLTNDGLQSVAGVIGWSLQSLMGEILDQGSMETIIEGQSSKNFGTQIFELSERERATTVFRAEFLVQGRCVSRNEVSFVPDKHLELVKPAIAYTLSQVKGEYQLMISVDTYAKFIEITVKDRNVIFSDNYFNLLAGEERVISFNSDYPVRLDSISVRSLYDSYN